MSTFFLLGCLFCHFFFWRKNSVTPRFLWQRQIVMAASFVTAEDAKRSPHLKAARQELLRQKNLNAKFVLAAARGKRDEVVDFLDRGLVHVNSVRTPDENGKVCPVSVEKLRLRFLFTFVFFLPS